MCDCQRYSNLRNESKKTQVELQPKQETGFYFENQPVLEVTYFFIHASGEIFHIFCFSQPLKLDIFL